MFAILIIERLEVRCEKNLGLMANKRAGSRFNGKPNNKPHNIISSWKHLRVIAELITPIDFNRISSHETSCL